MSRDDKSYKRKKKGVQPQPLFLITCEGEKTENYYFSEFPYCNSLGAANQLGQYYLTNAVYIKKAAGQHCGVVDTARTVFLELKKRGLLIKPQDVWCVFDCDNDIDSTRQAVERAHILGYNSIYSIQCFELWYLLHYQELNGVVNKEEYDKKISQYIGQEYSHEIKGMYKTLFEQQTDAIRRAERLWNNADRDGDLFCDPVTNVHILVEALNKAHANRYKG